MANIAGVYDKKKKEDGGGESDDEDKNKFYVGGTVSCHCVSFVCSAVTRCLPFDCSVRRMGAVAGQVSLWWIPRMVVTVAIHMPESNRKLLPQQTPLVLVIVASLRSLAMASQWTMAHSVH
jgi:hypothetical protein